jgi:hypothetical protein
VAERGFLPGEEALWIDEIRHQLKVLRLRALECYAAAGLGIGGTELAAAVRAGRQLIRLAPLRESGYRRAAADLRRPFRAIDLDGDGELLTYCTIGGRASTAWFTLTYLLGRDRVRVYDGSWAEWGRMTSTPVERL